ncbi:MAG: hypothetical protein ACREVK_05450 [Gammaproteobacteria bacterium]
MDVRRSWSAELAAETALSDPALADACNALPAADFVFDPVERNVEDAARPADVPVTLGLIILASWLNVNPYNCGCTSV